jgi:hypothetical protein
MLQVAVFVMIILWEHLNNFVRRVSVYVKFVGYNLKVFLPLAVNIHYLSLNELKLNENFARPNCFTIKKKYYVKNVAY